MKTLKLLFVYLTFAIFCTAQAQDDLGRTVVMPPFRVLAEMLELKPVRNGKNGPVVAILVSGVLQDSAAQKVGIKKGMFITSIQGMEVKGKTEAELVADTSKIKHPDDNILVIKAQKTFRNSEPIEFKIPIPPARKPPQTIAQR
jgi:S1-C subfamily serine protease